MTRRLRTDGSWVPRVARSALGMRALVAAVIVFAAARTVGAQVQRQTVDSTVAPGTVTVVGAVRDAAGRPIVGAEARVDERRAALTDTTGHFLVRGVPFDTVELVVRRIGYERGMVQLTPTQSGVRVVVAVELAASPFSLPSILVEGKAYDKGLWDAGFYKRQKAGYGTYFDPDFVRHYGGASLATLVREVSRVHVERDGSQEYAYGRIAGVACRLNIYVDGVFRRDAMTGMGSGDRGVGLNLLVPKDDIYAVEVYPSINSLPSEFARVGPKAGARRAPVSRIPGQNTYGPPPRGEATNNDAACGAIVIWTKWGLAGRIATDSARTR